MTTPTPPRAQAAKTRPILMSTELVRQTTKKTNPKTETRRAAKFEPPSEPIAIERYHPTRTDRHGDQHPGKEMFGVYGEDWDRKCPYGAPGDQLWIKETVSFSWDGRPVCNTKPSEVDKRATVWYRANDDRPTWAETNWTPSIFMPRWASRITLEIKDIGFERLQEITDQDIQREGLPSRAAFVTKWDQLNGKGHWDTNPYVWVIRFNRIQTTTQPKQQQQQPPTHKDNP